MFSLMVLLTLQGQSHSSSRSALIRMAKFVVQLFLNLIALDISASKPKWNGLWLERNINPVRVNHGSRH